MLPKIGIPGQTLVEITLIIFNSISEKFYGTCGKIIYIVSCKPGLL
jgi:hypothetical protein